MFDNSDVGLNQILKNDLDKIVLDEYVFSDSQCDDLLKKQRNISMKHNWVYSQDEEIDFVSKQTIYDRWMKMESVPKKRINDMGIDSISKQVIINEDENLIINEEINLISKEIEPVSKQITNNNIVNSLDQDLGFLDTILSKDCNEAISICDLIITTCDNDFISCVKRKNNFFICQRDLNICEALYNDCEKKILTLGDSDCKEEFLKFKIQKDKV